MKSNKSSKLIWYLVLIAVLFGIGGGVAALTSRINYTWYWNRVPQYFIFTGNLDQYAPADGIAYVEDSKIPGKVKVVIEKDDGSVTESLLDDGTLVIIDGDIVREGDKLGAVEMTKLGILLLGLWVTLKISFYSSILGMVIGLFTGLFRISKNPLLQGLSTIYVEIIRGTPLLVQIFIFYFFIGTVLDLSRFIAGTVALAVFAGAYIGEIVRAGIQSIDRGQMEAARSLGMNYLQAMIYIILPQAFKRVLPALAGQFISLVKDSSLVSVIAITDLTKAGREVITSTFATFEIWFTVAGMYLVLTFSLSLLTRYIERRFSASD